MKQKVKSILAVIIALIIMTGCSMKEIISVKITEDKKASIDMTIAYGNETIDQLMAFNNSENLESSEEMPTYTDAERWAYLESEMATSDTEGYKVERYEKDDFKGYRFTTEECALDDLVSDGSSETVNLTNDGLGAIKSLFTKNGDEYTMSLQGSNSDSMSSAEDTSELDIEMRITITLPSPAKSHNATEVSEDKLTYSWDLMKVEKAELVFEIKGNPSEEKVDVKEEKPTSFEAPLLKEVWSKASEWAELELYGALERNLIPGTFSDKDFTVSINRKDFAAVAVKLYEAITMTKAQVALDNPFTDTDDEYVLKALNVGITTGTSENEFSPDKEITREQMATMLTRAIEKAGIDTKVDLENATRFTDDDQMSDWSRDAIYFMSGNEIIKGTGDNIFGVKNNSTYEQALIIALRSVNSLKK